MSIGSDNDRQSITLPKKLWSDLKAEAEKVKASGQKVTVSELIQRAIEDAWAVGEPEELAWQRRVDQLARDMEQFRAEVATAFQEMHGHLTGWIDEMKRGGPTGTVPEQTPAEALRSQYREASGGEPADPFASTSPRDPAPQPKRWWRRG